MIARVLAILAAAAVALSSAPALAAEPGATAPGSSFFEGERGLSAKLSAGPALRRMYSVPFYGADIDVALGAQTGSGGWFGVGGVFVARSGEGLATWQTRLGGSWEAPIGRLHLGPSVRASVLRISRASTDGHLTAVGLGLGGFGTYDVYHGEELAVFLGLRGDLDLYFASWGDDDPLLLGAALTLGLRVF